MAHLLLTELQIQANKERALARFNNTPVDDDTPRPPCPLDSAQSRRMPMPVIIH